MLHPQEVIVWYVIPAIRKELAKAWKSEGLSNKKCAELLKVTPPAVSQYSKSKRASKVSFPKNIKESIKESAKKIREKPLLLRLEVQKILEEAKNKKFTCKVHKKFGIPCDDEVCYQ